MKPTILAIDDDPIILDMYELVLGEEYNLFTAPSGAAGLDILKAHPRVDIILSDIMMPEMDGYETCRRIRENPASAHVKVILVSSKMKLDDRLSGYQVGANDYITKPFEASELLAKVKVFLRLKNAEEIDQIKNNFINLVNHEARTPLTAIFGYAELLLESPGLSDQDQMFVEKIIEQGKLLLRSSEHTILLSNLKSGNVAIANKEIRLAELLTRHQRRFEREAESKQLSWQFHCDDDLQIAGDAKLIGLAIEALIENAVQHSRHNSAVQIKAHATDDQIKIEVANEGKQIAPHLFEAIFDELAEQDVQHHHRGQHMSLAIARRIAEAHDGMLSVHNRDNGPVFTLSVKHSPIEPR